MVDYKPYCHFVFTSAAQSFMRVVFQLPDKYKPVLDAAGNQVIRYSSDPVIKFFYIQIQIVYDAGAISKQYDYQLTLDASIGYDVKLQFVETTIYEPATVTVKGKGTSTQEDADSSDDDFAFA